MGHWKNYDDLESSLSVEELIVTLNAMREKETNERKFLAALKGIDLDKGSSGSEEVEKQDDITSLQGLSAEQAGFGIGQGLGYISVGG